MRTLRASEIAQFMYCQRAWWYAREGQPSANESWLRAGEHWHTRHGRDVMMAGCLRVLGYGLMIASIVSAAAFLTARILG